MLSVNTTRRSTELFFVVDFKAHYRVKLRRYETIIGIKPY